jgi:uncharacterized membrane protein YhaH (DUF805 family)
MYSQAIVSMSLGNCREKDHSENYNALFRKESRRRFLYFFTIWVLTFYINFLNRLLWFATFGYPRAFFNHITSFAVLATIVIMNTCPK